MRYAVSVLVTGMGNNIHGGGKTSVMWAAVTHTGEGVKPETIGAPTPLRAFF